MKKYFVYGCLLCLLVHNVQSQNLIIKGKIKCLNQSVNTTKGAENIVVIPAYKPSIATITASRPSGYFEFNTGVPMSRLQDKMVTVYVVSRCSECKELAKRVFISEDQDRQNRNDDKRYVTIKDWMLNTKCQQAELLPLAADSVLNLVVKQPEQNLDKASAATALVGAPTFLNFLTSIVTVVGTTGFPQNDFFVTSISPGKINYGKSLLVSPLYQSANTGFNFSPSRDMSEAVFWNPSATALTSKVGNISLLTNVKNNIKLSGFYKINEKFSLGAGGIYTRQDEFRQVFFKQNLVERREDSVQMKLKEYGVFLSPAYKINNRLSVGLSIKSTWQQFNIPDVVNVNGKGKGKFFDIKINNQHFDVDLSATFKASPAFQVGLNLMNLAGTSLYADAFISGQNDIPVQQQRSLGLGLLYKWQRLNVGTDLLVTEDGLYDAAIGVNYVPFNNALLSAGFAVNQKSFSAAFRMKHFRIAYIDDNDWMINERKKGKSAILDGKIYGGFIFDLN